MRSIILTSFLLISQFLFAQYSKGDIISIKGVKGIVFKIDDSGRHGTIMSVKAFRGAKNLYCSKSSLLKDISMNDVDDGARNTQNLFNYAEANHIPLSQYPVYNWCKSLGKGWYIPSVNQLSQFVNYWLGNEIEEENWDDDESNSKESNLPIKKQINKKLLEAGGIPFLNGVFTSTLDNDEKIHVFQYDRKKDFWQFIQLSPMKIDENCVGRAFYDF